VLVTGTVSIRHCQYQALSVSGTVSIRHCQYQEVLVSGTVGIGHSQYHALSVSGTVSIRRCQYQKVSISGIVSGSVSIRHCQYQEVSVSGTVSISFQILNNVAQIKTIQNGVRERGHVWGEENLQVGTFFETLYCEWTQEERWLPYSLNSFSSPKSVNLKYKIHFYLPLYFAKSCPLLPPQRGNFEHSQFSTEMSKSIYVLNCISLLMERNININIWYTKGCMTVYGLTDTNRTVMFQSAVSHMIFSVFQ